MTDNIKTKNMFLQGLKKKAPPTTIVTKLPVLVEDLDSAAITQQSPLELKKLEEELKAICVKYLDLRQHSSTAVLQLYLVLQRFQKDVLAKKL